MAYWQEFNVQWLTAIVDETGAPAVSYIWYTTPWNLSNTASPVWIIKRITDDLAWNVTIAFAWNKNSNKNIWDDRATLNYW